MLKCQSNVKKCVDISENYYVDIGLKELIIIGLVCLKKFDGRILAKYPVLGWSYLVCMLLKTVVKLLHVLRFFVLD